MMRRALLMIALLALAFGAAAEEPSPRFFIERIEVRNAHRVAPRLVISESLLQEGTEVSEDDLHAAAARLARLPFLLAADFALEKGSSRGRYNLVIRVTETTPFFFLLDARPMVVDEGPRTVAYQTDPAAESKDAALGFRWFVGGRGIVHVGVTARRDRQAFTSNYSAWAVGYTQYDLFGTGAFATVNIRLPFDSPGGGGLSPQLVAGVPLTSRQTLTLDYEDTSFRRDPIRVRGIDFDRQDTERLISLAWTYNSTNEPFVPTRGTLLRVAPLRAMNDRASWHAGRTDTLPTAYTSHSDGNGVDAIALRYWELSELHSLSAGILAGWAEVDSREHPNLFGSDVRWRPTYQVLRAGYSRSLRPGHPASGDSRIELEGRYVRRQRDVLEGAERFGVSPDHDSSRQMSVSWVERSSWGTLRLGIGYAWGY